MNKTAELAYWINEREHMRLKREETDLPPPWSADPNMATVRYCNIRREDDAVTRWIRANWNHPNDYAWKFVLGRMINYVPSLEELNEGMKQFPNSDLKQMKAQLKHRRDHGDKIFTSAYTISTCGKAIRRLAWSTSDR